MRHFVQIATLMLLLQAGSAHAEAWSGLSDPTRPAYGAAAPGATAPRLQTTVVSAGRKLAVIDGRTYRVGSRFGNQTVVDIRPYEVILSGSNGERALRLLPPVTKASAAAQVQP